MVLDWSSQLCLGLPGLEGLPSFRMVGGWIEFMSLGVVFRVVFARGGGKVRFVGATWVGDCWVYEVDRAAKRRETSN